MADRLGADIHVASFGMVLDGKTQRLEFPRAQIDSLKGTSGDLVYTAKEVVLDKVYTLLDRTHWSAAAGSAGGLQLATADGAFKIAVERVELARGVQVSGTAETGGIEILAPQATFHDVTVELPRLVELKEGRAAEVATTALVKAVDAPLRQERLHVLDSLAGEISVTLKVVLDLPVFGTRTLDQKLRIPIREGMLDFRALADSLDWLEGQFVDLGVKNDRLMLSWRVPVFGKSHEIVSFQLDTIARTVAVFDRVPLRSLADFRVPEVAAPGPKGKPKAKELVRSVTLSDLSIDLSMAAPRSVEIGHGAVQFGGDAEPGIVGLSLKGSMVYPPGPGGLTGKVALLDITAKDLALGPATLTVDRLHLGSIDPIELRFDGFDPSGLTAQIHRITATNLSLRLSSP
jgi:hypothetical protein